MADLVVYYSLSGKSRQVAEWLAAGLDAHLDEIVEVHPRDFAFRGILRCGLDSMLRRKPAIAPMKHREEIFDRVILACPVWGGRIAGPARTWLFDHGRAAPALGLALQSGGGVAYGGVMKEFERVIGRPPQPLLTISEYDFGNKIAERKVGDFARLVAGAAATAPPG